MAALKQQLQQKLQQKLSPQQIQLIRLLELTEIEFEEAVFIFSACIRELFFKGILQIKEI